jgi:hypothetical protein
VSFVLCVCFHKLLEKLLKYIIITDLIYIYSYKASISIVVLLHPFKKLLYFFEINLRSKPHIPRYQLASHLSSLLCTPLHHRHDEPHDTRMWRRESMVAKPTGSKPPFIASTFTSTSYPYPGPDYRCRCFAPRRARPPRLFFSTGTTSPPSTYHRTTLMSLPPPSDTAPT